MTLAAALSLSALLSPGTAFADERDDLKAAYNKALGQYNNLELDPALAVLNEALQGKGADDVATAPLRMLRAVIIFSNTGNKKQTEAAFVEAVKADYNVALPADLRSPDLQKLLDKARTSSGATKPTESMRHESPRTDACGQDLKFEAITGGVPDGGQAALYWRPKGGGEFKSVTMDLFGSIATAQVLAGDHGDVPVEYFIYVFDGANKPLGNKGDEQNPLVAEVTCVKEVPKPKEPEKPPPPKNTLPRFFLHIGLGTGVGVARGVADQSYSQYTPAGGFNYGLKEFACALARWSSGTSDLPANSNEYLNKMGGTVMSYGTPYNMNINELAMAYNADECAEHHAIKGGMAWAPFHVTPEFGGRIGKRIVLSAFGRLQLVTASKVFRDDPDAALSASYMNDVINPNPEGVRSKPGFTAAGGLKLRYFLGNDEKKFRLYVGGFLGGGFARTRVKMGFANDRNGNSVPDDKEAAFDTGSGVCVPVWPYNYDCANPDSPQSLAAVQQAATVAANADSSQRIDTVRMGGGMIGGLFGFHFQVVKNFALFGELNVGVWFPRTTSLLIDLNVGPAITF